VRLIVLQMLPQLAWLAPEFSEACSKENFMQADASKDRRSNFPMALPEHGVIV
jgi:hypothetical protein